MDKTTKRAKDLYTGLCGTCDMANGCTYLSTPRRPVLQCLEYEEASAVEGASRHNGVAAAGRSRLGVTVKGARVRQEPGLCSTCEVRATCTFPNMEGGVWFCEEYK
jgi:hypothetical protein